MSKNVIITGTSRGIGFELAQKFANENHNVLAISRNCKPLDAINHKNITTLAVDLSNAEDIKKVADFVAQHWKSVDILINNAGKLVNKPFTALTHQDFLDVYQVNVFGVAEITKLMIPF